MNHCSIAAETRGSSLSPLLSPVSRDGFRHAANGVAPHGPITEGGRRRSGIATPDQLTCLDLAVGEVGVERPHDIAEEAAHAKGVCHFVEQHSGSASWDGLTRDDRASLVRQIYGSPLNAFRHLWETLHGTEASAANPFIAALTFGVTPANIDSTDQA